MPETVDDGSVSEVPVPVVPFPAWKCRMTPVTMDVAVVHDGLRLVETVAELRAGDRLPDAYTVLDISVKSCEIVFFYTV